MNRIKELRQHFGITQTDFAKALNVSQGTISAYETGRTEPDLATMRRIAEYFGVSLDSLFGDEIESASPRDGAAPTTVEARIISAGIDRMPEADRKRALEMMKLLFAQCEEFYEGADADDT